MLTEFRTLPYPGIQGRFIVWREPQTQRDNLVSLGHITPGCGGYVIERTDYPVRKWNHATVESAANELIRAYKTDTERRAELSRMTVEAVVLSSPFFV